jgi:hypothetical protein
LLSAALPDAWAEKPEEEAAADGIRTGRDSEDYRHAAGVDLVKLKF